MDPTSQEFPHGIAVIGMAGRFPKAKTVDEFWESLCRGEEGVRFFTDEELEAVGVDRTLLRHPQYVKAKAILDDIDCFDAAYFGINPREAEIMDPQHRLFLETAVHALENAGVNPEGFPGRIGVYASSSLNTYLLHHIYPNPHLVESVGVYQTLIGNDKDFLPTRVSYFLNLKGPSVSVQTACSSSLVAVHEACQSLMCGECDIALAGGVAVRVPQVSGYLYQVGGIHSPDGHCRPFDKDAKGTVSGNGVGIVVLKRLEDALRDRDTIYAVIRGTAVNNDGSEKIGYTAPSVKGQAKVIAEAHAVAEVDPASITYVETHGTATPLGDPIEFEALTKAFGTTGEKQFCAIGSVKSNIGHLDAAAGIAGLIKTILALHHKTIPPSLHFREPNPQLDMENSPFYVNTECMPWKRRGTPLRAGVSSFGMGGTNAHAVLEEAPPLPGSGPSREHQVLVLSAKTPSALERAKTRLAAFLKKHPDVPLADAAYTLQTGRMTHPFAYSLVCRNVREAVEGLDSGAGAFGRSLENPSVVFLFPGQGTQRVHMASDLYRREETFRRAVDECADMLRPHLGLDIRAVLYPNEAGKETARDLLLRTEIAQPALFVTEYALARMWMEWGVRPRAVAGHSLGEYAAACLAGIFSLGDTLALVAERGKLMQRLERGAMLAVSLSPEEIRSVLGDELSLAAINGDRLCVVSGAYGKIERAERLLEEKGIPHRRLYTSHAFHSEMMDPILETFTSFVSRMRLHPPKMGVISGYTGTWLQPSEAVNPVFWRNQLRETVQFHRVIGTMGQIPQAVILEVGPGPTLSELCRRGLPPDGGRRILSTFDRNGSGKAVYQALGKLWEAGVPIDWNAYYREERRRRIPLPGYPFEPTRFWVHAGGATQPAAHSLKNVGEGPGEKHAVYGRPDAGRAVTPPETETEKRIAAIWQELLGVEPIGVNDDFFDLGGHSLLATQLLTRLREAFGIDIQLHDLFEATTVKKQAERIEAFRVRELDADVKHLLEEIKRLSPEEVSRLLKEEHKGDGGS